MATKLRSPQYPAFGLAKAVELVRKIHAKLHTHKGPPLVFAQAIGYTTMNGKSITALSTLKKYDLLEEAGKELKVSKTSLTILFEPANTPAWKAAMRRAAMAPELFSRITSQFPGAVPPGDELVRSFLLQNGFLLSTVELPVRAFRDTIELVKDLWNEYNGDSGEVSVKTAQKPDEDQVDLSDPEIEVGDLVQWESNGILRMEKPMVVRAIQDGWAFVEGSETGIPMEELILEQKSGGLAPAAPPRLALATPPVQQATLAPSEKEWLRGTLSKEASYRLIVTGELGSREIGKLIKLLEAQKLVLEEDDLADLA